MARGNMAVVALVAAIAAVAAVDAFRSDAPEPQETLHEAAEWLRASGAAGTLLLSDEECRRARVELPELGHTEVVRITGCRVYGQRGNLRILGGAVAWYAYPEGITTLLTPADLAGRTAELGSPGSEASVVRAAWLGSTRFAVLVSVSDSERVLALFRRSEVAGVLARLDASFGELRTSRRFGYVAAISDRGELRVFRADGEPVPLPASLRSPRAVAWSPNEELTAVATADGIAIFPTGSTDAPAVLVPVSAHDLDWLG